MPKNMPQTHPDALSKGLVCGGCQWYTSGFRGNCQTIREVAVDTQACIEYTKVLKDVFFEILTDKFLLGIRQELKHKKFLIAESIFDELKGYVIDQDFDNFKYGSQQDLELLTKTLLKTVPLRARVSTIYTTLIDIQHDFDELIERAWMWMYSKYSLIRDLKNEAIRKSAMDRVLPEVLVIRKNINKGLELSKFLDEKLDKNEWALKAALESAAPLVFSNTNIPGNRNVR